MTDDERDELLIELRTNMQRLVKDIDGNGQPGLRDRVTVVETRLNERDRTVLKTGATTSGLTALVGLIVAFVSQHFGIKF